MIDDTVSGLALGVRDLNVYYGQSHALQGVSLDIPAHQILAIVGRNGMGKTTLCNTIMGFLPAASGAINIGHTNVLGADPYAIAELGVGYVPQGRRVWPTLTVNEHLRLAETRGSAWSMDRIYSTFPSLAKRRNNGGNQLSGGEQQMLAISRALLGNPHLLIMDEPTEGLAPVIVDRVEELLLHLATGEDVTILLVEQNLGVAMRVSKRIAVMVNGRIEVELDAAELEADKDMQQRLLGVSSSEGLPDDVPQTASPTVVVSDEKPNAPIQSLVGFNRFSYGNPLAANRTSANYPRAGIVKPITRWDHQTLQPAHVSGPGRSAHSAHPNGRVWAKTAYVVGTFDTKKHELFFTRDSLVKMGLKTVTVDLSSVDQPSPADISSRIVANSHPRGATAVFTGDRGTAITEMAEAFRYFLRSCRDVSGIIGLGGSGGTALTTPAMQDLAVGVPKIMVSTMASGDVGAYVGATDICMMYSVTDVSGINRISERVLSNASHALAGMILNERPVKNNHKSAIGLTMFGVTTPCVQRVRKKLEHAFDCLVFHATGTGGQSVEKLIDSGLISGFLDISTTEVCDLLVGGMLSAGEDRIGAPARTGVPYVGSCGALDMVNFHALDTVPEKFRERNLYTHNAQVTLMRTTKEENRYIGEWIGAKLNRCQGSVRFFIPEGGVSALDAPGQPFYDPEADKALFDALERTVKQTKNRRLIRMPHNINDPAFADAMAAEFTKIMA